MKKSAFSSLGTVMGSPGASMLGLMGSTGPTLTMIGLDEITIRAQIRTEFEDDDYTLQSLADSIAAHGILQPILVRPNPTGEGYELVAGERRVRAARLAGLAEVPAQVSELTDQEAEDAQAIENIERKNLTLLEEAKKLQRDIDALGSREAVLKKYGKTDAWLSKRLSLLSLPEQAQRMISENLSADIESINNIKQVEKVDPEAAKAFVDELAKAKPGTNTRKASADLKEEVKGTKKEKAKKVEPAPVIEPEPEQGEDFALPLEEVQAKVVTAQTILDRAFYRIAEEGAKPKAVLTELENLDEVEEWLQTFYNMGAESRDMGSKVLSGFARGVFAPEGHRALALVAFLQGGDSAAKFNLLNILGAASDR